MRVRTRFAPSPTGELHLGNARTAVLNWLVARHHRGDFVLRFEDTDVERNVQEAEAAILSGLDWLGLDRDEDPVAGGPHAPYRQSERLLLYRDHAERLLQAGLAFHCYCTQEDVEARGAVTLEAGGRARYDGHCRDLEADREAAFRAEGRVPVVRFRVEPGAVAFTDRLRGRITIDAAEFGDFVILRSDGRPTYNFAVVVDDILMEITHVIRGVGHLSNTPKQVLLYRALEVDPPEFVHVPTVLAPGGGKLSKREGAPGLSHHRREGFHPDGVVNYLSLLSWSAPSGEEVLTPADLVREMDLERLGTTDVVLDPAKMRWLSGQHIRREAPDVLARRIEPHVEPARYGLTERDLVALAEILRPRIHLLSEAREEADRIFGEPDLDGTEARAVLRAAGAADALEAVAGEWERLPAWSPEEIRGGLREGGRAAGARGAALYRPLRVALTGELHGPELPDVAYALGRERAVHRLRGAAEAVARAER